jgi:hypothetical protein
MASGLRYGPARPFVAGKMSQAKTWVGYTGRFRSPSNAEEAMKEHGFEHAIAELVEAAALQAEITQHRLAFEWGQVVFTRAVQLWNDIEAHEALAYEDKVVAQVNMLDEATSSLYRLQKMLAQSRRVLQRHQRQLAH